MKNLSKLERIILMAIPNFILRRVLLRFKKYDFLKNTINTQTPIYFDMWYNQKVKGHCQSAYWPIHPTSIVGNFQNIYCGIETNPGYSPGNYIQAFGKIFIDDYTQIGPNVGIISSNHDLYNNSSHIINEVRIGKYCWIGMNSVVLPGVVMGDFTIVGAGSVVTKSFPDGFCVIGGNPAKLIKKIEKEKCVRSKSNYEYNGYIKHQNFELYRKEFLNI